MNNMYYSLLPDELRAMVFIYLDIKDLKIISNIYNLYYNDEIWKLIIQLSFGTKILSTVIQSEFRSLKYSWIKI